MPVRIPLLRILRTKGYCPVLAEGGVFAYLRRSCAGLAMEQELRWQFRSTLSVPGHIPAQMNMVGSCLAAYRWNWATARKTRPRPDQKERLMKHQRPGTSGRNEPLRYPSQDRQQRNSRQLTLTDSMADAPARASVPSAARYSPRVLVLAAAAVLVAAAVIVAVVRPGRGPSGQAITLPIASRSYVGLYERGTTTSYAGIDRFAHAIGRQPNLVSYYSWWGEPFQAGFASAAAKHGAVPLVQLNPVNVRLSAIASGRYDPYLRSFASAVRAYRRPVVIGFGHEMNGWWYSWGYQQASPASFIAAWRHIVTLFRAQNAWNVTWLWTINVIDKQQSRTVPAPAPWWPGNSYVTWVGIDGYYYERSWTFAPLFGPTIKAVRRLTHDPILISETGAAPAVGQPAKVTDLFAGIRAYGLLGFVWFNVNKEQDWQLSSPAALAAFRRGAETYKRPVP